MKARGWCRRITYQWWKSIPGPESHEEAEPREEEYTTIDVDDVEEWNGPSFVSDGVDLRCLEQHSWIETHAEDSIHAVSVEI
jgi:hypothetical protein